MQCGCESPSTGEKCEWSTHPGSLHSWGDWVEHDLDYWEAEGGRTLPDEED